MSATSNSFWSATESIRDDLQDIAALGVDTYSNLEASDDPESVADDLQRILDKLVAMENRLSATIPAIREIAKAFDAMAAIKS